MLIWKINAEVLHHINFLKLGLRKAVTFFRRTSNTTIIRNWFCFNRLSTIFGLFNEINSWPFFIPSIFFSYISCAIIQTPF